MSLCVCVRVCRVCARMRACICTLMLVRERTRACVRACVRVCAHVCVRARVRPSVYRSVRVCAHACRGSRAERREGGEEGRGKERLLASEHLRGEDCLYSKDAGEERGRCDGKG